MSGNPTMPTNVVPMPTNWPGPMFQPGAQSPSCFSQLASLNACYDSIQMMEQILSKVMVDLITNDPAVIAAIQAELAKAGAGLPITGITNGVAAQPGIVGEYVQLGTSFNYTAATQTQVFTLGVLQPGDWYCDSWVYTGPIDGINYLLTPTPAGFSNSMQGALWPVSTPMATENGIVMGPPAQALISVPTAIVFTVSTNVSATGTAGSGTISFSALRVR